MELFDLRLWSEFTAAGGDPSLPAMVDQIAIDSRRIDSTKALFVALPGSHSDGHTFIQQAAQAGAHYALVNKNFVAANLPEMILLRVDDPLQAFQAIASAYRQQFKCYVIAIVGSYGKTMVKDLLEEMISTTLPVLASPESFNSQIGVALSLLNIGEEHEIALIEASISQKNEMDRLINMIDPDCAILTHIGKKHLATLGDMKTTAAEIAKLLIHVPSEQWVLIANDRLLQPHLSQLKSKLHFWNENTPDLPHARRLSPEHAAKMPYRIDFPDGTHYVSQASFGFYYFLDLINITVKAAWKLGVSSEAIRATLNTYTAEPMRSEIWRSPTGITFINDTYCSDPQSVDQALSYLQEAPSDSRKVFIFGGMRGKRQHEETDYRRIGQGIVRSKIDLLLLVGPHKFDSLISEVSTYSPNMEIYKFLNYQEAFSQMQTWVKHDDTILIKGEKKPTLDNLTEAFNESISNNQCLISLAAIQSNIISIRHKLPKGTRIMVMVKALAYGTNDIRMSQFLARCGIDLLGVSYVDEGIVLKRAGIVQSLFVLNAAIYEVGKVVKWELEVGVSEKAFIEVLSAEAVRQNRSIKVHLHIDTGMSRFGCRPEEALELAKTILESPMLELEGIFTHFASADNPDDDFFTILQAQKLDEVINHLKNANIEIPWKHAANSSGMMRFDFPQFNMVRIGLAVYGLHPSQATQKVMELRLALSLISHIVGINTCKAGETISYGRSYMVSREQQRIAVLPIGYFDGLHRNYSGKGEVIIRGQKAPMVGKICMDYMMVDVTDIPNVAIGDSVLIFGEDDHGNYLSPEKLAIGADSIVYELVTCLGPRIQRIFTYEETHQVKV